MSKETSIGGDFLDLTCAIVAAYVTRNNIPSADLARLISATHEALAKLGAPPTVVVEKPQPPVPIKKTITPDYLISLEDGRQYKSLKRHLSSHGLTPEEYRRKWGLPQDYPMVAASYAAQRSELAKSFGLGQARGGQMVSRASQAATAAASQRRGRPRKAANAGVK